MFRLSFFESWLLGNYKMQIESSMNEEKLCNFFT